jgi:hypothetical protein
MGYHSLTDAGQFYSVDSNDQVSEHILAGNSRKRRDIATIAADVQAMSQAAAVEQGVALKNRTPKSKPIPDDGTLGLTLRGLLKRWKVAPQTARAKLVSANLPVKGDELYRWTTILEAEGVSQSIAATATRESHEELFEDLIKPNTVAALLGFKDISTVRKLALSGAIPPEAYVTFGTRQIRHFRPAFIEQERRHRSPLRLV